MGVSEERNKDYNDKVIEDSRSEKSAAVSPGDIEQGELSEELDEGGVSKEKKEIWIQHEEHSNGKVGSHGDLDTTTADNKPLE